MSVGLSGVNSPALWSCTHVHQYDDGMTETRGERKERTRRSLLDAALEANLDAPYACKAGVCSTCRAKVLEGETEMAINHALEDYEVKQGYVLTCQCFPLSDKVVVSYDQ